MVSQDLLDEIALRVGRHCQQAKGYEDGPWVNPLIPVDCISALVMARFLVEEEAFDHYVAVAPEGHVYGYFIEQLGTPVLSVHVDYPPRRCQLLDDLSVLRGARVLIIEDDVISGVTLGLVVDALQEYKPRSLALYLGRRKDDQQMGSIVPEIEQVFVAEDCLDPSLREHYEASFISFFGAAEGGNEG